jgi:hypothetical protein
VQIALVALFIVFAYGLNITNAYGYGVNQSDPNDCPTPTETGTTDLLLRSWCDGSQDLENGTDQNDTDDEYAYPYPDE